MRIIRQLWSMIFLFLNLGCGLTGKGETMKDTKSGIPANRVSAEEPETLPFSIGGKAVSQTQFRDFVKALKSPQRNWTCYDTTDGGVTTWEQEDSKGVWWRIETGQGYESAMPLSPANL